MLRALAGYAGLIGAMAALSPASAQPVGWRELAADPGQFIGRPVEMRPAYCGNGGDRPVYQCSTDGPVYVEAKVLTGKGRKTVDAECGGLDVVEQSETCRFGVRFVPRSFRNATDIEDGKIILVIETDTADLSP